MSPRYTELRAHTSFSFGAAAVAPEALVAQAAALGYEALGLTDCADLGGVVRFVLEARRRGVKPVVGVELEVDGHPMAFLARSAEGYRNLGALVTRSRSGLVSEWRPDDAGRAAGAPARGRPRVAWRDVAERSAGLVALTGPATGALGARLRAGERHEAARRLHEWRDAFGERLAVEVQLHYTGRGEEALAGALVALAERERVRWVVANDPRYVDAAGRLAFDVLTALRQQCTVDDAARRGLLLPNDGWMLQPPELMARRWAGRAAGVEASAEIAALCDFELGWVRPPLPDWPGMHEGCTADEMLRRHVLDGARARWGDELSGRQRTQLEHELRVIGKLGFAGFFLTMHEAVCEARRRRILCQGRGSAANSAVAYCLGITAVDPVQHGLLFERFLSEARVDGLTEAPDIDLDLEHDRREEILDYMYEKYGRAHAAITGVVQQYSAPTAVQDVCRAYGVPVDTSRALSKRLHAHEPAAGAELLRAGLAAAHGLDVTTPRGQAMLRAIAAFDGLPRLRSTHPGGFVLSGAPLGDHCPIEPTTMGRTILQYDKDDLDAVGIPKFDFLALGSLAMVRRAFDVIERRTGTRPELYALPDDDAATYAMIAAGDTVGTFQIESRAQIASLVHTRPEKLYDIVVQVALIRPGPIQAKFVHPYTERRRGRERIAYPEGLGELLAPILDRTQGIPIFQEQAMAIAMKLGGYTAAEADELRRAMGHQRKAARLAAALEQLRDRMVRERGVSEAVAAQLVSDFRSFANYGFPESHAWSFALIAYATAWLKANHPAAFYAGLLNAWPMGFYSPATLVHDARRHGVEVRRPCVRDGLVECTVEETEDVDRPALRIGWRHVRGLGERALSALGEAREAGPFGSIADVVRRARLDRGDAAALARAGAFAAWVPERRRAVWAALGVAGDRLPLAPAHGVHDGAEGARAQPAGDGFAPPPLDRDEEIALDYGAVGLSTAGHPMEHHRPWLQRIGASDSAALAQCRGGERVIVGGMVTVRQRPSTAKGTLFLLLEDEWGAVNVVVWKRLAEENREVVRQAPFLLVYGTVERDGAELSVIGHKFAPITDERGVAYRSYDFR